jgi:hypothetical protein
MGYEGAERTLKLRESPPCRWDDLPARLCVQGQVTASAVTTLAPSDAMTRRPPPATSMFDDLAVVVYMEM